MVRTKMNLDYFDDRCPIGKGGLIINQVYGVKSYGGLSPSFGSKYCLVAELVNALHC